jgi:hypothetical protein
MGPCVRRDDFGRGTFWNVIEAGLRFAHLSTSRFKQPAMCKHGFAISLLVCASFGLHVSPSDIRAQGKPGARCTRGLACKCT